MSESEEEGSPPPMPDLGAKQMDDLLDGKKIRVEVSPKDALHRIKVGYGMILFGLLFVLLAVADDGPESEDYDSMDEYYEAVESYGKRAQVYPAITLFLLFAGIVTISAGLVLNGVELDKEMHHYVRIALIVGGVFILGLFVSGMFEFFTAILDVF